MQRVNVQARRVVGLLQIVGMTLPIVNFAINASRGRGQEPVKPPAAAAKAEPATAVPTPIDVYRTYLNAVKKNDLAAAKNCWCITGDDSRGALDVIVGIRVASHRLNAAMDAAGLDGKQFGKMLVRDDCTDKAIDRTLARLQRSQFTVKGDRAQLKIQWEKDDGYPNPAFEFGDGPIPFRNVSGGWKIDANAHCDIEKAEDFFAGTWGEAFRTQMTVANEVAVGLESGKLKSATDVVQTLEKHLGSLEGRIPLTKRVVYLEDSPTRYLRIKKGNPNISLAAGEQLPHRKDLKYPRRIEGGLDFVFETMYGWDHPRIVVETKDTKGYEVVFNPADTKAMEIVAGKLGMTVGEEEREILALRITVAKGGHHLKQVEKPDKPQRESLVIHKTAKTGERQRIWRLPGVTMDALAMFLETRSRRPVANMTSLAGYYDLELDDESVRVAPEETGQPTPLGQTGLQLHWERTKMKVVVVKDKP